MASCGQWALRVGSGQFMLQEVGGGHSEQVVVGSCRHGRAREVVIVSSERSRQPGRSRVDVPGAARLKVAGGGPWTCEQWVARVGRHYGGGWWMLQWVVDGERCRW